MPRKGRYLQGIIEPRNKLFELKAKQKFWDSLQVGTGIRIKVLKRAAKVLPPEIVADVKRKHRKEREIAAQNIEESVNEMLLAEKELALARAKRAQIPTGTKRILLSPRATWRAWRMNLKRKFRRTK